MDALRRIASYYRLQFTVLRSWRPSGRSAVRRIIVMLIVSTVSLIATSAILPGISISRPGVAIAAAVALAAFMLLIRPVALGPSGGHLGDRGARRHARASRCSRSCSSRGWSRASRCRASSPPSSAPSSIALFTMVLSSVLGVDQDESYWAALVQQLATRAPGRDPYRQAGRRDRPDRRPRAPDPRPPDPRRPRAVHREVGPRRDDDPRQAGRRCCRRRRRPARPASCTATTASSRRSAGGRRTASG